MCSKLGYSTVRWQIGTSEQQCIVSTTVEELSGNLSAFGDFQPDFLGAIFPTSRRILDGSCNHSSSVAEGAGDDSAHHALRLKRIIVTPAESLDEPYMI